jgi:hypothetical protein
VCPTAFRARKRRALGDDRPNEPCRRKRIHDSLVVDPSRRGEPGENRGQHTRSASRRCGDDHAHRRVDLLNGERPCEHIAKKRPGERSRRSVAQLRGITTDQPGRRAKVAVHAALDGAPHDVKRAAQRRSNVLDGPSLIARLRLERNARERNTLRFGGGDGRMQ